MKRWAAYLDGANGRCYLVTVHAWTEEEARARAQVALSANRQHRESYRSWFEQGSQVRLDPIY